MRDEPRELLTPHILYGEVTRVRDDHRNQQATHAEVRDRGRDHRDRLRGASVIRRRMEETAVHVGARQRSEDEQTRVEQQLVRRPATTYMAGYGDHGSDE